MCCVPAAHRMDRPWRGGPETPEEIGCRDEAAPATPRAGSVCVCVCVCVREGGSFGMLYVSTSDLQMAVGH